MTQPQAEPQVVRIVGIGGSLAPNSKSLAALRVALAGAEAAGASTQLFSVAELNLPPFRRGLEPSPRAAQALCDAVCMAHGLIWSSPLYHGTISGAFKNVLDWLDLLGDRDPPYLTDKVIGMLATAGGTHGLQAINTMEFVVRALRGWAVPLVMAVPRAWQAFDAAGQPVEPSMRDQLQALGREVVRAARQLGESGVCDYSTAPDSDD